jgi:hypothetical protein
LIKEECILKNKNKLRPYNKLPVFYNSCLINFGSHLVYVGNSFTELVLLHGKELDFKT